MNGYENGKIYKLECNGLVYYGSTKQTLEERLREHKKKYNQYLNGKGNYYSSFEILKLQDYKIELVEDYPCNSKKELELRESHFITNFECCNKCIARRTKRDYYEANKAKILEKRKEYVKKNYDKILENNKAYNKESRRAKKIKDIK